MSRLLSNMIEGACVGGIIGGAIDALAIGGATLAAGPVGFVVATSVVSSKVAIGTLIGAGSGVVRTVKEETDKKQKTEQ
jgi:hypothetical protein